MPELHIHRNGDMLETTFGEHSSRIPWSDVASLKLTSENAREYGRDLFEYVTQDAGLRDALTNLSEEERLVLLVEEPEVAAIPWEYMRLPESEGDLLLASRNIFVRGIPETNRKAAFVPESPLTIVAVPVSPVNEERVLNTEGEWSDLARMVRKQEHTLTLIRARPPTLATMKRALSKKGTNVVQFMGHSGVLNGQGILLFEDDLGKTKYVDARLFKNFLDARTFLVVLNSCQSAVTASATPNTYNLTTPLSNIAEAIVQKGVPYALGMQFSLPDDAALLITTLFYESLLKGSNVEEAVRDMRAELEQSERLYHAKTAYSEEINSWWLAGLPVLYTNQRDAAPALKLDVGQATIQPNLERLNKTCDLNALPTPAHFVGRGDYISETLALLLNPSTEGFIVLHGLGGIGKTALSRVIAQRISYYYDDHVFAYSFETFTRFDNAGNEVVNEQFAATFYSTLATYYGLDPKQFPDERTLQNAIITQRRNIRSLLVLDNIETLIEAQKRKDEQAIHLASFVSKLKEDKNVVLLTSRDTPPSDWGHCKVIELGGLDDFNGEKLFLTSLADDRRDAAKSADCIALTQYVRGHPLCIRLLAGRFSDDSAKNLHDFLTNVQNELANARQKTPSGEDPNRHTTLSECLEYSIRRLTDEQKKVLYTVGIFLAPFLPEWAEHVLDDKEQTRKLLQDLIRLGLLEGSMIKFEDGELTQLEMHPMLRQHIKAEIDKLDREVRERYGLVYKSLAQQAWEPIGGYNSSAAMRYLLIQSLPDCEAALKEEALSPLLRALLACYLSLPYEQRGQIQYALTLCEQALKITRELDDVKGIAITQYTMANLLFDQGKVHEAMHLYKQSLNLYQELEDMQGISTTQNRMANLLRKQGRVHEAMHLYKQSLKITSELGDVRGIAVTQRLIADVLHQQGRVREAMDLYEESLKNLQKLGEVREVAITQHAMAVLLAEQGEIERAIPLYQESLKIYQELGEVVSISRIWNQLAILLRQKGRIEEAIQLYQQSLEVSRKIGDVREIAVVLTNYSNLLWKQGKYKQALKVVWEAYASLQETDFPRDTHIIRDFIKSFKDNFSGDEQQFGTLWLQATSTSQPDWLRSVQTGSPTNNHVSSELLKVIAAFVNAPDKNAMKRALEEHQELLFQREIEKVFGLLIEQAKITGSQQAVEKFMMSLAILRACKADGIEKTFERIRDKGANK